MKAKLKNRLRRRAKIRIPKRSQLAAPPGSIAPPSSDDQHSPAIEVLSYGPELLQEKVLDKLTLHQIQSGPCIVRWVNVEGVHDPDMIQSLANVFGWHSLVVEDILSMHQRPKMEEYDDHAYVVMHMPSGQDGLPLEQINLLFSHDYVATIQAGAPGDALDAVRERVRKSRGRIRTAGNDYLAYAVIDAILDHYFPILERLNSRLEALETQLGTSASEGTFAEIHAIRNDLHTIWRTVSATREAINKLSRSELECITDGTRLYLRDCQDHCAQLLDAVTACRELSSSLMELHQSQVSNRTSEGMRILTMIATIFMPMNFVAALYGMNFDTQASPWNMPELGWHFGYPAALLFMVSIGVGFALWFRKSGRLAGVRSNGDSH